MATFLIVSGTPQLLVESLTNINDLHAPYESLFDRTNLYKKFLDKNRFMVLHTYHLPNNSRIANLQYVDYSQSLVKSFVQGEEIEEAIYAYGGSDSEHVGKNITSTGWFYPEYLEKESFTLTNLDEMKKPVWGEEPYKHGHESVYVLIEHYT